jgi:NAD+ synthase (glutamine-hydrolysing)
MEAGLNREINLGRDLGYLRVGAAVPSLRVADVDYNVKAILTMVEKARREGVQVLIFPEMSVTGYTLGDLVQHKALLTKTDAGLQEILAKSAGHPLVIVVGAPLTADHKIFNSAVVINDGHILGAVPKTLLPNYKEFYDERWFESGSHTRSSLINLAGQTAVPFGTDLLFKLKGAAAAILGIEVCEDLWTPFSPHEYQAVAGANVLLNLSASNEVLLKDGWRRIIVSAESGRCLAAYCYVSSSIGESSNDVVFGGHSLIAENGLLLTESPRLCVENALIIADVDIERLNFDRRTTTSFGSATGSEKQFRFIETEVADILPAKIWRNIVPQPFVPADPSQRAERCREVFSMQVGALAKKLTGANKKNLVLGISGGLDSTLALLAAVKTMEFLNLPRANVHAFTLPGFGTTRRTKNNSIKLCRALGVSFEEINIRATCESQLKDLGHNGKQDVVFENVQARYRTAFLFNKANELDAIMLGTGDLTEVALGWSTFAGDQVSHYHINVSVPKTLVRYLIRWVADEELCRTPAQKILGDILATPISPELLKPSNGRISQKSEDIIGPVELADFFLYPFIRFGMRPGKILYLADEVRRLGLFEGHYTLDDLHKWLKSFVTRFFANQFKRTCMPEGPKVGSVSLSPRGDWRMPSDATPQLWLDDLEAMYRRLTTPNGK